MSAHTASVDVSTRLICVWKSSLLGGSSSYTAGCIASPNELSIRIDVKHSLNVSAILSSAKVCAEKRAYATKQSIKIRWRSGIWIECAMEKGDAMGTMEDHHSRLRRPPIKRETASADSGDPAWGIAPECLAPVGEDPLAV